MKVSRRGLFAVFAGAGSALIAKRPAAAPQVPTSVRLMNAESMSLTGPGARTCALLRANLGDEIYAVWFKSLEFESFDGTVVTFSSPIKFIRNWIAEHYADELLACTRAEFHDAERVAVVVRRPGLSRVNRPAGGAALEV